jgi:hypothetical protein
MNGSDDYASYDGLWHDGGILRWRVVQHTLRMSSYDVPSLTGHTVGAGESGGLAMFQGGEFASLAIAWTIDFVKGTGRHVFYTAFYFEDGSYFVTLGEGETRATEDGKTADFEGTARFLQGGGRFEDIQGSGSYTGKRFAPLGTNAEVYLDYRMSRGESAPTL